jgi:uncharacterized delta-60 repeat protein
LPNFTPVLTVASSVSFTEGSLPITLSPTGTVVDTEFKASNNYGGSILTIGRVSSPTDVFTSTSVLSALTDGSALIYNTSVVGTVSNNTGTLRITFNANATQTVVDKVIQNIQYQNTSEAPPASIGLTWTFSDSVNTGAATTTVNITPVNDPPSITSGPSSGIQYTETTADESYPSPTSGSTSGTLTAVDVDSSSLTFGIVGGQTDSSNTNNIALSGAYGKLTINKSSGAYSFSPNSLGIQGIKTTGTETYKFSVTDGSLFGYFDLTVGVTGANDPTTLDGVATGKINAYGLLTAQGQLVSTDRDSGDSNFIIQTSRAGSYGQFSIDATGKWTYLLNNPTLAKNALASASILTETFNYALASGSTGKVVVDIDAINQAPSFGVNNNQGDGIATFSLSNFLVTTNAIAIQADGKVIHVGQTQTSASQAPSDFLIARTNTDGSLDSSFAGTGSVKTSQLSTGYDSLNAVIINNTNGGIITGGSYTSGSILFGYNSQGQLDTNFGSGGKVLNVFSSSPESVQSIYQQSDGKILVAGTTSNGDGSYKFALARFLSNGTRDTSFNTAITFNGSVHTIYSIAQQSDGKILVGGTGWGGSTNYYDFALARYNSNGTLDNTFGTYGIVATNFNDGWDVIKKIYILSDGKILVGGYSASGNGYQDTSIAIARYTNQGVLDTTFSGSGKATIPLAGSWRGSQDIAFQTDGKIIASGSTDIYGIAPALEVIRINTDGSLDTGFSLDGKVDITKPSGAQGSYVNVVGPDGKVYLSGAGYSSALISLTSDGSINNAFDATPITSTSPKFTEKGTSVVIRSNLSIVDSELSALDSYNGASISLQRQGGANSEDIFAKSGSLGELTEGSSLNVSSTTVGLVTKNSAGVLTLTFNANATQAFVNQVLGSISYSNSSSNPPASVSLNWTFSDGNTSSQGSGGAQTANITTVVDITAVNDAPVISLTTNSPDYFSDTSSDDVFTDATGTLSATDVDNATNTLVFGVSGGTDIGNGTVQKVGTYGTITVNKSTGSYKYVINNSAVQSMKAYTSSSESFTFTVTDGQNTPTTNKTYYFYGSNDPTTFSGSTSGNVSSNSTLTSSGSLVAQDRDSGETVFTAQSNKTGTFGKFTLGTNGSWSYTLDPSLNSYKGLSNGQSATDSFDATTAGSAKQTISINVTGINDAPYFSVGDGTFKTSAIWEYSAVLQTDGKFIIVGSDGLTRYNLDGSIDTGKVSYASGFGTGDSILQSDGKLLAFSVAYGTGGSNDTDVSLVRYNSNLTLDSTFGTNGKVTTHISNFSEWASSMATQSDGKIVVVGSTDTVTSGLPKRNVLIIRYNSNGSVDTTFGTNGSKVFSIGTLDDYAMSVAIQPDGKILVGGNTKVSTSDINFFIARLDQSGNLDTTFGTSGKITTNVSGDDNFCEFKLQQDGKIVAVGSADYHKTNAIVRYNSNGSLDTTFGSSGIKTFKILSGGANDWNEIRDIALQKDGKIVLGGQSASSSSGYDQNFSVARLNIDGSLDTSFANSGTKLTDLGSTTEYGKNLAILSTGQIIQLGSSSGTGVVLYKSNGELDTSFATPTSVNSFSSYTEKGAPQSIDSNVVITDSDAATKGNYSGASITLSRTGGASSEDVFSGTSRLSGIYEGSQLILDASLHVGQVKVNSNGILTIVFNANATQIAVNAVLSSLAYLNASNSPPSSVNIGWTFSDGDTGSSGFANPLTSFAETTIQITPTNEQCDGIDSVRTVKTNTTYTFSLADFAYPEQGLGVLSSGVLITAPSVGTLLYSGYSISPGTQITVTAQELANGLLSYRQTAATSTSSYASASFQVKSQDGNSSDSTANTLVFNVSSSLTMAPVATSYLDTPALDTFNNFSGSLVASSSSTAVQSYGITGGTNSVDDLSVYKSGTYGILTVVKATGAYSYQPNSSVINQINSTKYEAFNITASNSTETAYSTFSVRLNSSGNANEPTIFSGDSTASVTEDGVLSASGTLVVTDVDLGDSLITPKNTTGTYGSFSIDSNGNWNYLLNNSLNSIQKIGNGQSLTDLITVQSAGGAYQTIVIKINGVNDAPTSSNQTISINEDTSKYFSIDDFGFIDIDNLSSLASITITKLPTDSQRFSFDWQPVTLNQTILASDLSKLRYSPASNANGLSYSSFEFSVNDGITSSLTSYMMTLNVTPVNDSPTTTNQTININEDSVKVLRISDFGILDPDIGDQVSYIKISPNFNSGGLKFGNFNVTSSNYPGGLTVTSADINAGKLTITPTPLTFGNNYGYFSYIAADSAGAQSGISGGVQTYSQFYWNVVQINHLPTGYIYISDNPLVGRVLRVNSTLADLDGLGVITYTWKANGNTIGTGNSYTLTPSELGKSITITANYTDTDGNYESVTSSPSILVFNNSLPSGNVTFTGFAMKGKTLNASNTLSDLDWIAGISYPITYTWKASGAVVGFGSTYTITQSDVGKYISVTASYTDQYGTTESVTSNSSDLVIANSLPTGNLLISGNATHGQMLTATSTLSDQDGLGNISYSWKANGSYIGTGSTYTISLPDIGKTITLTASYIDGFDTAESVTSSNAIEVAQKFIGGSENDTFVGIKKSFSRNGFFGGGGDDDITGNSKADVAEYSGNLSNYTISASDGLITISDNRGSGFDGTDTLHGINLLKFADGMEFVGLAAQRVSITGLEQRDNIIQVMENKIYCGTNLAEKFFVYSNVSSMILAGDGDTVHLMSGSFTDYTYSARGSELQIIKGDFMTTVNLAGNVIIETEIGHGLNAKLDFSQPTPRVMLDTQWVTGGSIDASLLNNHAVI